MTKIEIAEQYMRDAQPALKYFTDLSSRVSEKEFKTTVYIIHGIGYSELNEQTKEKIDSVIKEGYGDYLRMCELVKDGLYYSEGFEASQNPKSVGYKILRNDIKFFIFGFVLH